MDNTGNRLNLLGSVIRDAIYDHLKWFLTQNNIMQFTKRPSKRLIMEGEAAHSFLFGKYKLDSFIHVYCLDGMTNVSAIRRYVKKLEKEALKKRNTLSKLPTTMNSIINCIDPRYEFGRKIFTSVKSETNED